VFATCCQAGGIKRMDSYIIAMEDAHTSLLNIVSPDSTALRGKRVSLFAVFDGHGGHTVARYAGEHLHRRISIDPDFERENLHVALKSAFLGLDSDLREGEGLGLY
jgi:protein phosphatase 2C family protein 2/3